MLKAYEKLKKRYLLMSFSDIFLRLLYVHNPGEVAYGDGYNVLM